MRIGCVVLVCFDILLQLDAEGKGLIFGCLDKISQKKCLFGVIVLQ